MIDALINGKLIRDTETKTSSKGTATLAGVFYKPHLFMKYAYPEVSKVSKHL
jgi:hypothetical protein